MERPSKNGYYIGLAKVISERSTCIRRKYGAIIVNNDETVSTGYNGSPPGCINCSDVNKCKRSEMGVPSGERYELCVSIHAEENAIISASRKDMIGSTLYLYGYEVGQRLPINNPEPCILCKKRIIRAGIKEVVSLVYTNKHAEFRTIDVQSYIDDINNMKL